MVRLLLRMKAELENVESIEFPPDYTFNLDVTQSGGTEERKGVTLSASEAFEIPNSRGTANLILKFGGSKQPATINVEHVRGGQGRHPSVHRGRQREICPHRLLRMQRDGTHKLDANKRLCRARRENSIQQRGFGRGLGGIRRGCQQKRGDLRPGIRLRRPQKIRLNCLLREWRVAACTQERRLACMHAGGSLLCIRACREHASIMSAYVQGAHAHTLHACASAHTELRTPSRTASFEWLLDRGTHEAAEPYCCCCCREQQQQQHTWQLYSSHSSSSSPSSSQPL